MIIVENGEGLENANSYTSIEFADSYFTDRNNQKWLELTQEEKESALINATQEIDNIYSWKGIKKTIRQSLSFPRIDLFDNDGYKVEGIPNKLQYAVCEGAFLSSTGKSLYINKNANGAVTSEKIGELAFTYDTSKELKNETVYNNINSLLKGLYRSSGSIVSSKVSRV